MNPADLEAEGFADGDVVEIDSGHAQILGIVAQAPDVAQGVISMAHGWGDAPEHDGEVRSIGSNTGRLACNDRDFDPVTGMPVMSAIPVNVRLPNASLAGTVQ
jgi:anaerobic selenocysteine-containing dehydrogenase